MHILGLSFGFHDASAALLRDATVVAAAAEERFTRRKHDASLPLRAIEFCLAQGGIAPAAVDVVVLHEQPLTKFDRIVHSALIDPRPGHDWLVDTTRGGIAQGRFDVQSRVAAALNVPIERLRTVEHHAAHAASAFFASPFHEATVVTLDGVGEYEAMTVSRGRGTHLEKLYAVNIPHSLGLFYSAFTAFLGFEVNE